LLKINVMAVGRGVLPENYPRIAMMQSAKNRRGGDGPPSLDRVVRPCSIPMRARLIVIDRVRGQPPPQMPFAKDQDVVQAAAPSCSDQALGIRVLPGLPR
jgi:hypothetical protein